MDQVVVAARPQCVAKPLVPEVLILAALIVRGKFEQDASVRGGFAKDGVGKVDDASWAFRCGGMDICREIRCFLQQAVAHHSVVFTLNGDLRQPALP